MPGLRRKTKALLCVALAALLLALVFCFAPAQPARADAPLMRELSERDIIASAQPAVLQPFAHSLRLALIVLFCAMPALALLLPLRGRDSRAPFDPPAPRDHLMLPLGSQAPPLF